VAPGYHEPPDVDPPPLKYEQVFDDHAGAPGLRAPRAVQPSSITTSPSTQSRTSRRALLVLAIGCGVAAAAYWLVSQPVAAPVSAPVSTPVQAPAPVRVPVSTPVQVPVATPVPVPVSTPASVPVSATVPEVPVDAGPTPNPNAIYPETGATDTYDAQLALARRLKRGSRADAAYRRAIELNPAGSPALAELARLMLARNHTREAAELAERATAVDPTNALAWVTLGAARQARGDRQGARQAYQNCAKLGKGQYVSECRAMLR